MTTITGQIEKTEKEIEKDEARLETIDRLRRLKDMPNEEWEQLSDEKKTLTKQIKLNKEELKGLRWENRKTMLFSVLVLGLVYAVYHFIIVSPSQGQPDR